jgi:replication factor A1
VIEGSPSSEPVEVRLKDLRVSDVPVQIVARIVSVERREYSRPTDGRRRSFLTGLLSDGTASVRFTWWEPPNDEVDRGTIIRAQNVQVREYQGRPEVSFSFRTRVAPAGPADLPKVDSEEVPFRTISELQSRSEGFRLEARVLRVGPKAVTVGAEQRQVYEGILGDGTGLVAFSSWSDFHLASNEAIRIAGAYVRTFRGRPQLVLDETSIVARIDPGRLPPIEALLPSAPRSLARLEAAGGSESAVVEGLVVALLPPSGLVYRCPTCRRPVSGGLCSQHGAVKGVADLRARLVLDDGTSTVTLNVDRPMTEALWGVTLDEALERLRRSPDPSLLESSLADEVVGLRLRARGRVFPDDFGLNLYPESVERVGVELDPRAKELRNRWEAGRGAA